MAKIYLYKEYNDSDPYDCEEITVFSNKESAVKCLVQRFNDLVGVSMDKYTDTDEAKNDSKASDTITPEYVSYDTGDGILFLVVEEKETVPASIVSENTDTCRQRLSDIDKRASTMS